MMFLLKNADLLLKTTEKNIDLFFPSAEKIELLLRKRRISTAADNYFSQ